MLDYPQLLNQVSFQFLQLGLYLWLYGFMHAAEEVLKHHALQNKFGKFILDLLSWRIQVQPLKSRYDKAIKRLLEFLYYNIIFVKYCCKYCK